MHIYKEYLLWSYLFTHLIVFSLTTFLLNFAQMYPDAVTVCYCHMLIIVARIFCHTGTTLSIAHFLTQSNNERSTALCWWWQISCNHRRETVTYCCHSHLHSGPVVPWTILPHTSYIKWHHMCHAIYKGLTLFKFIHFNAKLQHQCRPRSEFQSIVE